MTSWFARWMLALFQTKKLDEVLAVERHENIGPCQSCHEHGPVFWHRKHQRAIDAHNVSHEIELGLQLLPTLRGFPAELVEVALGFPDDPMARLENPSHVTGQAEKRARGSLF